MKKVTQKQVHDWMVQLAKSQGYYGRLLHAFNAADAKVRRNFMNDLHKKMVIAIWDFIAYCEE